MHWRASSSTVGRTTTTVACACSSSGRRRTTSCASGHGRVLRLKRVGEGRDVGQMLSLVKLVATRQNLDWPVLDRRLAIGLEA